MHLLHSCSPRWHYDSMQAHVPLCRCPHGARALRFPPLSKQERCQRRSRGEERSDYRATELRLNGDMVRASRQAGKGRDTMGQGGS